MTAVIDSAVLIDCRQGDTRAKQELDQYDDLRYSIVSWMQVLCGADTEGEKEAAEHLFNAMMRVPCVHSP